VDPSGVNSSASTVYDAFGRAIQSTDANGNLRSQTYESSGACSRRWIHQRDPGGYYDAFGRCSPSAMRSITPPASPTTTPTARDDDHPGIDRGHHRAQPLRPDQTITDGAEQHPVPYDQDGNLRQVTDAKQQISTKLYDKADRLTDTTDATATRSLHVDAANRVLTRTVDPGTVT